MDELPETATPENDELNRPLVAFVGRLPREVEAARSARLQAKAPLKAVYEPRIKAHIDIHRRALAFLSESHQWIADTFDFDVQGNTRLVAVWQMAGRCIGIARLMLDSLELGYTAEVLHLGRALHEASRLLNVFHMVNEDDLVRCWLAGEYVSPSDCRQAEERFDGFLAEAMKARGEEPMPTRRGEKSREVYGHLSEAAHHRRRWTEDVVFAQERIMFTGPTDDYHRRAATVGSLLPVVEEAVIGVGDALAQVVPQPTWYAECVQPLLDGFAALRDSQPLSE